MRRADPPSMATPYVPAPGDCPDGMCWAEPLKEACDHWQAETDRLRLQVAALENAGMETAAKLGEAEDYIARLDRALTQRNIEVGRLRDGDPRFLRLLSKIADECMTDEPDVVWIGAAARTAVDQAEGGMHG